MMFFSIHSGGIKACSVPLLHLLFLQSSCAVAQPHDKWAYWHIVSSLHNPPSPQSKSRSFCPSTWNSDEGNVRIGYHLDLSGISFSSTGWRWGEQGIYSKIQFILSAFMGQSYQDEFCFRIPAFCFSEICLIWFHQHYLFFLVYSFYTAKFFHILSYISNCKKQIDLAFIANFPVEYHDCVWIKYDNTLLFLIKIRCDPLVYSARKMFGIGIIWTGLIWILAN